MGARSGGQGCYPGLQGLLKPLGQGNNHNHDNEDDEDDYDDDDVGDDYDDNDGKGVNLVCRVYSNPLARVIIMMRMMMTVMRMMIVMMMMMMMLGTMIRARGLH